MNKAIALIGSMLFAAAPMTGRADGGAATEFCLIGQFDLGARLQGTSPSSGEFYPARWCVVSEDDSQRVHFSASGHINADVRDEFAVSYVPPDLVRIVRRSAPPDLDFIDADIADEALRYRRLDPRRLVEEFEANPDRFEPASEGLLSRGHRPGSMKVRIREGRLLSLQTRAELPLRGRVPVLWRWSWDDEDAPSLELTVDDVVLLRARGGWRDLPAHEAGALWQASGDEAPRQIPGHVWPSRVAMEIEPLADGVYLVKGVRTGFHHLVVDTASGLVIGDAPAGWVELPQIPPADLVPGLGISGLSQRFIEFLSEKLPGRPLRAVVLTHAHDDHVGGARAFAGAGAAIYAPTEVAEFLERALNRAEMPGDRLTDLSRSVEIIPVSERLVIEDPAKPVELLDLSGGPHVAAAIGIWLPESGYFFQSDLHVPESEADTPSERRAASECWFAGWAAKHLSPAAVVLSSHSTIRTPVSHLGRYLASAPCQGAD